MVDVSFLNPPLLNARLLLSLRVGGLGITDWERTVGIVSKLGQILDSVFYNLPERSTHLRQGRTWLLLYLERLLSNRGVKRWLDVWGYPLLLYADIQSWEVRKSKRV